MIVDCHTHIWQSPDQLGQLDLGGGSSGAGGFGGGSGGAGPSGRGGRPIPGHGTDKHHKPARIPIPPTMAGSKSAWRVVPAADPEHHWAESRTVDKSIVLGFKSRYLHAEIPNKYVAEYVHRFPQKLIGFAGIDPTEKGAVSEVRIAKEQLKLKGVTVSPA